MNLINKTQKKFIENKRDTVRLIGRIENAINKIKEERKQYIHDDVYNTSDNATVKGRKEKGFRNQLLKERDDLQISQTKLKVLEDAVKEKVGVPVYEELEKLFNADFTGSIAEKKELNSKIGGLKQQIIKLEQQAENAYLRQVRAEGQKRTFRKNWGAEKISCLIENPTAKEFQNKDAQTVVTKICGETEKLWRAEFDKRRAEENRIAEKARLGKEKEIKAKRELRERALGICSGKLPFPNFLKGRFTPQNINLNELEYYLQNEPKPKPSTIGKMKEAVSELLGGAL